MNADRLTAGQLLSYGAPALPLAAAGLPLYIFVPTFYTESIGLGLAQVGLALILARTLDVVSDPLVGTLSDRLRPPLRRRKSVILAGLPLLAVSIHFLMVPPGGADLAYLLLWSILVYLGWTLVTLPYTAWGAEISRDYHERSRVTAMREGCVILGTLGAVTMPTVLGEDGGLGETLRVLAVALIVLLPLTVGLALSRVPEPTHYDPPVPWRQGISLLLANRPFLRLIFAYLLNGAANGLPATLFLLFVHHRLQAESHAGWLLLVYFVAGITALPFWLMLSRRFGKHRAWCWSMIWAAVVFAWVPFLGPGDVFAFAVICVLSGLSLGVDMALPASMQADVVDLDRTRGGGNRAGLFFGLWGMATKLALALAVGIAFPLLDLFGFDASGDNDEAALLALALLYAALPVAIKLVAVALVWTFPLGEMEQQRLQALNTVAEGGRVAATDVGVVGLDPRARGM